MNVQNLSKKLAIVFCSVSAIGFAGVSGFVDSRVSTGGAVSSSGIANDGVNSPNFSVFDGAVYFSDKMGSTSVMVDLPFASGTGTNNNFTIAGGKTQAYVTHSYDFGLSWSLGQWDSPLGMEVNDSINNRFSTQGLLYRSVSTTHQGLLLAYNNGPIEFDAAVTNHFDSGPRNGNNFDYIGKLKYSKDGIYASGAYVHYKDVSTAESMMLMDFNLGYSASHFTVDAEALFFKPASTGAQTGMGLGGWFGYDINNMWNMAARVEYTSKMHLNTDGASVLMWAVGPQCKINDKMVVKSDFAMSHTKASSAADATKESQFVLSAQYKF